MDQGMRVAMLLTDAYGGFGGISRFNRDFLEGLDATPSVAHVHALPRLIPETIDDIIPESVIYDRRAAGGLKAYIRRLASLAVFGRKLDLVVCGHVNLLTAAYLLARLHRCPVALIIHGIDAWSPTSHKRANFLAGRVDHVLSVSSCTADRFCAWSGLPRERVTLLPNCVDLAAFPVQARNETLVERYGLGDAKVLLTVGRLASEERYKGFDEVIEVLPSLHKVEPNVKYLIVGDGPDASRLKQKVAYMGLDRHVVFAGRVPEAEKAAHYGLADAYVMPSSGEGFGIVYLEAAACGVPVIGSRTDGSRDALLDGRLGHLVTPSDPSEIMKAVLEVIRVPHPRSRRPELDYFSKPQFNRRLQGFLQEKVIPAGT